MRHGVIGLLIVLLVSPAAHAWVPAEGPLMTRWAKDVNPDNPLPEYPRPQLRRQAWTNLNGLWQYAIRPKDQGRPDEWDGEILVPFCVESALSGVGKRVGEDQKLWYRREFSMSDAAGGPGRWLLHFGAVDWHAVVWVNGKIVGEHKGGYDPFTFDITEAAKPGQRQELVVSVWDPTDAGRQPRGKQKQEPGGIWYTPVTGIWQTVWLEPVPRKYIKGLKITPDLDAKSVTVTVDAEAEADHAVSIEVLDRGHTFATGIGTVGKPVTVKLPKVKPWSPDDPHLYNLTVRLNEVEGVESYFGMRKIEVKPDERGHQRLYLNNEPLFQYGPLDQGWWPDGLYTAPTDEALKYDVEITKKLGFNMARKHVKVEPARWYYWCDRLGLLVWQDMPSSTGGPQWVRDETRPGPQWQRDAESAEQFRKELAAMVRTFYNHPSIVMWVPFNERWGQFETKAIVDYNRELDPTRPINEASGGNWVFAGDVLDVHNYPSPRLPKARDGMALVCGEFGGLGMPIKDHLWQEDRNWGYRTYHDKQKLHSHYETLMHQLHPLIGDGLAAAVYTQTTDVEIEVNGLLTYDREVLKFDADQLAGWHARLYQPPPRAVKLLPASDGADDDAQAWRYTLAAPGEKWFAEQYDDAKWQQGKAAFGRTDTPNARVRTKWESADIWIRRSFELKEKPVGPVFFSIRHDEDATVYINGAKALELTRWNNSYSLVPGDVEPRKLLRRGKNVIAVHCRQTGGGQCIDVGLIEMRPQDN